MKATEWTEAFASGKMDRVESTTNWARFQDG